MINSPVLRKSVWQQQNNEGPYTLHFIMLNINCITKIKKNHRIIVNGEKVEAIPIKSELDKAALSLHRYSI